MNKWLTEMEPTERDNRFGDMIMNFPERLNSANGNVHFAVWLFEVDQILVERVMSDHSNMTDWYWHDSYSNDYSPSDAVDEFLSSETDAILSGVGEL